MAGDSSSTTTSVSPSAPSLPPSPIPGIPNLAQVAIKLNRSNYLLWKSQLLPILYGTDMLKYMDRIRMLADELSLIQLPLTDRDLIGTVLDGLNLDYDVIVNSVQTMSTPPSFEELYSMLLNREKRLEIYHQPSP
ncbi:hypothetical protein POM88_046148 [Heracleum sosnowskyi]|uniref:Retrotransposon Copia-like N-terminal domain-containing protein n=1 Tax=Heracleum sosnowskyi TaxID=360622 RepID=A0AAD8H719_9APIA|nr:hypothetical protein POM88_046148 [Heracleum sosnowskyi]